MEEHIYLLQYPNRPRNRPYNSQYGATPVDMRIKPTAGFIEVDVKLSTHHNFNKYMGLKWGDAAKASRELHNNSGTYGPAAGLIATKARGGLGRGSALKDTASRELELENDLQDFRTAEQNQKIHSTQTLGGQIIRHDAELESGKPHYFVGAFQDDQLHLTKITGTVQMRPNFHHLDAEEERARVASSRAAAESSGPQPDPVARAVQQKVVSKEEVETLEKRLQKTLAGAAKEQWIRMEYVDDEDQLAYDTFEEKLKVRETQDVPHLKSQMDDDAYLDAISLPRLDSPTRRRKRAPRRKETVEVEDGHGDDEMAG